MTGFVIREHRAGVAGQGPTCATSLCSSRLVHCSDVVHGCSTGLLLENGIEFGFVKMRTMAASAEQHKDIQVNQQEKPACSEMQRSDMFSQTLQPNNERHLTCKCTSMVHLAKPLSTEERNTSHLHMHRHGFTTHA